MRFNARLREPLKECFRPRSGNYESEYYVCDCDKELNLRVSVPARGIMNLNRKMENNRCLNFGFRPRSGNYESE